MLLFSLLLLFLLIGTRSCMFFFAPCRRRTVLHICMSFFDVLLHYPPALSLYFSQSTVMFFCSRSHDLSISLYLSVFTNQLWLSLFYPPFSYTPSFF
ncbi:hypothetical protein BDB00DRAFT_270030 [Zychaea mexicana]|uniref:uncharacterized protein n=1 Tax=Zychaea mexicana TaxID=64656 RepID=UPI0022FE3511|nr:uncharacterized protein BDB00DRAFT_270030 [Zychaea mexicana]KAI9495079.1 hypothetical protein BDB00DRAFT_270030 [Zychaea mexicana]